MSSLQRPSHYSADHCRLQLFILYLCCSALDERGGQDPLFAKFNFASKGFKFLPVEELCKVSARTNEVGKKFFNHYWNCGGREHAFAKAKAHVQKVSPHFTTIFTLFLFEISFLTFSFYS